MERRCGLVRDGFLDVVHVALEVGRIVGGGDGEAMMVRTVALRDRARVVGLVRLLSCSKSIVKACTGPAACWLIKARRTPESIPELRNRPTGTSLRICRRTVSSSNA